MGLTVRGGTPARVANPPGELREALIGVQRAIEDINWTNLSTDPAEDDQRGVDRVELIRRARRFKKQSPLAKQAASLLVNYVLGQGVALTANNKRLVARIVDEFWENHVNRQAFTSHAAMSEFLVGAFTDGAQYLVLFPDTDEGTVEMTTLDPLYVEDEIRDPDNWRIPLWYKVRRPKGKYDFKSGAYIPEGGDEFVYYRHWRNDRPLGGKGAPKRVEEGLVYPAKRGRGKFGESELAAAVDWLKAHKEFMEDRATISRAAASIAWRKKRKGGAPDVAAEVARLQSSLAASIRGNAYDSNPPPAAGSTIVENEMTNLEWVKTDTGGQAALADERVLRMMVGAGMGGIPNHYFGDEANANLATATAMELPLLKNYENWQKWLADIISDVIGFVLEVAHEAGRVGDRDDASRYTDRQLTAERVLDTGSAAPMHEADVTVKVTGGKVEKEGGEEGAAPAAAPALPPPPPKLVTVYDDEEPDTSAPVDWYVDVDFPPIVQKDVGPYVEALKIVYELLPMANPESAKLIVSMALNALGVNDVDQVMDRLYPRIAAEMEAGGLSVLPGGQQPAGQLPAGDPLAGLLNPGPTRMAESLTPHRVHRIIGIAREAADAIDRVDNGRARRAG